MEDEPEDSFQSQQRVYIRGFVRAGQRQDLIYKLIGDRTKKGKAFKPGFRDMLVPDLDNPDNPRNVFKDMELAWHEKTEHRMGRWFLMEFVLVGYVEGTREGTRKDQRSPDLMAQVPGKIQQVAVPGIEEPAPTPDKKKLDAEKKAEPQPAKKEAVAPVKTEKAEPPVGKKPGKGVFVMPTQMPKPKKK